MLRGTITKLIETANVLEHNVAVALGLRWPPGKEMAPDLAFLGEGTETAKSGPSLAESVLEEIRKGILWAVPTKRRSLERRKIRFHGILNDHWKLLHPKRNLLTCIHCGHWHEPGVLCPHCYKKVMDETNLLKDKIVETLGLNPIEQDVVVLYQDDVANSKSSEYFEGKRIVEIDRPRPSWWSGNLAQPSTQQPSDSKEVKPLEVA